LKSSALFGRAPSTFLGGREWGEQDRLLAFAYQLYLDLVCPACGGNVQVCRNDSNEGIFEALDTKCHRRAAVDERTGQQGFKPEPGQMFYASPIDDGLVKGSGLTYVASNGEG